MYNFPHSLLPQKWADYYGHPLAKALATKFLTEEPRQVIYITGIPGSGKTAFVLLLIKASRCLNRKPTEIEPCGVCRACQETGDIRMAERTLTDVYWLQPGLSSSETLNAQVKTALEAAEKGHLQTGDPNGVMWLIFDEFHKFPSNLRSLLLSKADVPDPHARVVYVFITMQEEALGTVERLAFRRRGSSVRLNPFSEQDIVEYLQAKFPECPLDVARLIAKSSEQSIGMAIANYNNILEADSSLDIDVAAMVLGFATNRHRLEIWRGLQKRIKFLELRKILTGIYRYAPPQKLALQLLEDIYLSSNSLGRAPTTEQMVGIHLLNQFLSNYSNNELVNYLPELYELNLVQEQVVLGVEDGMPKLGFLE